MAKGGTEKAWRKRPSTILWMLSLGQLISWGLVYYTFPLFVVPMTQELGWSRSGMFGALSAGLMVAGLCSIPVGAWIDRGHGRKLMTGGSLLAAALMLGVVAHRFPAAVLRHVDRARRQPGRACSMSRPSPSSPGSTGRATSRRSC